MAIKYRLPSQKFLLGAVILLIGFLIICLFSKVHGQQIAFKRDTTLLDSKGRVKAYRNSIVTFSDSGSEIDNVLSEKGKVITDREKLKPGEAFVIHRYDYKVFKTSEPTIKEVESDLLTVSSEGFSSEEQAAIRKALESWNVGVVRFVYQDEGQIKIRRQKLRVAALSAIVTVDGIISSADVWVDPSIQNLDALQSILSHEAGHWLGLPDRRERNSIMFHKTRGPGKGFDLAGPTRVDLEAVKGAH